MSGSAAGRRFERRLGRLLIAVTYVAVTLLLVGVVLLQRSEGGGLGMGGSPSGLMSARGAADFLTRATGVLATMFVLFSILLAVLAANHRTTTIDTSLARTPAAATAVPTAQPKGDAAPFAGGAENAGVPAGTATPADNSAVPLAR